MLLTAVRPANPQMTLASTTGVVDLAKTGCFNALIDVHIDCPKARLAVARAQRSPSSSAETRHVCAPHLACPSPTERLSATLLFFMRRSTIFPRGVRKLVRNQSWRLVSAGRGARGAGAPLALR